MLSFRTAAWARICLIGLAHFLIGWLLAIGLAFSRLYGNTPENGFSFLSLMGAIWAVFWFPVSQLPLIPLQYMVVLQLINSFAFAGMVSRIFFGVGMIDRQ